MLRCMLHEAPCTFRHKRRLSRSPPLRCPHNNCRCAALALLPTCTVVDSVPSHQLGRHMHEMSVYSSERNAKTSAHQFFELALQLIRSNVQLRWSGSSAPCSQSRSAVAVQCTHATPQSLLYLCRCTSTSIAAGVVQRRSRSGKSHADAETRPCPSRETGAVLGVIACRLKD